MRRLVLLGLALCAVAAAVVLLWPAAPASAPAAAPTAKAGPAPVAPLQPRPQAASALHRARLSGKVVDPGGAPASGADIQVLVGGAVIATARSGADGTFTLADLDPGELALVARKGALASAVLGPVPLAPGEELSGIELALAGAGSIEGTVLDAETREPIAGASVTAAGAGAASDTRGRFAVFALPPGVAVLRVEAAGYESREQSFNVADRPLRDVEVPLSRGAHIAGKVLGADGAPVAGAAVWAVPYRLQRGPLARAGAVTAEGGTFELSTPAGQVEVEATGPTGDTGKSEAMDLAPGGRREGVIVKLGPAAAVAGRVLDGSGAPASGAEVRLVGRDGVPLATGIADGGGSFFFPGLAPGPVTAVAALGDARGSAGPVTAEEGATVQLEVSLGSGAIAGMVVDDRGAPIAGASVSAWPEGTPRTMAATAVSGPDGAFALRGLPESLLRVSAAKGGTEGELRGVKAGARDLRIVVAGGQLVGIVLRNGRPATDFTLAVSPAKPGASGASAGRMLAPDGRFRMTLPPGAYQVQASAAGAIAASVTAEVPARGSSSEVRLDLVDGAVIRGHVLDARSGLPLAGARVSTTPGGASSFAQATDFPGVVNAVTSSDGSFVLAGVPVGRLPVFAQRAGYRWTNPVVVQTSPGAPAVAEIRLISGRGDEPVVFGGVGITLQATPTGVVAAAVLPGSPSWAAGVRQGDFIAAIDGASVQGMALPDVIDLIRGEVGAPVVLNMRRGDTYFDAVCVRAELRY